MFPNREEFGPNIIYFIPRRLNDFCKMAEFSTNVVIYKTTFVIKAVFDK